MTNIQELGKYGISSQVIRIWEESGIRSLLPVQQQAIEKGVLEGASLLVIAPTSSGKTFIGEIAAYKRAKEQAQVLYLVPLKAIGEEKFADFKTKYEDYGINVVISSSDHREFDEDIKRGDFHIAILTYEKLVALLVTNPEILRYCGLLIVDEIQMLADKTRGPELELLLTKILLSREGGDLQIVALSATLNGVEDLGKWLGLEPLRSNERPVELREGIYTPDGRFVYRGWKNSKKMGEERFPSLASPDHTTMLDALVEYLVDKGEQVLIFLSTREDTVTIAERLATKVLTLPPVSEAIGALDELEGTGARDTLKEVLRGGVAFHNADLLVEERLLVERFFREGAIRVVCATSTLAMGVNMPAKTVIVADIWKWARDERTQRWVREPISVAEYKNASGRAGRYALQDDFGRSVLIAKTEFEYDSYWAKYVVGQLERVVSQFGEQPLDLQVLDLIASKICQTTEEAVKFLLKTFAGYQKWTLETTRQEISGKIRDSIERNARAQTIVRKDGVLTATEQGRVCASRRISLETLEYLRKWLKSVEAFDNLETIYVAAQTEELARVSFRMSTPEFHSNKYIDYLRQIETERLVSSFITDDIPSDQQTLGYEKTKRLKMALIAYCWIQGHSLRELEGSFQEKAGPIRRLTAENLSWIVDTMADLATVTGRPREFAEQLKVIADRLVYGVPKEALLIAKLRVRGINRSEMMQLLKHGYDSPDKILDAELSAFDGVISRTRANRLRDELRKHIKDTLERQKRGHITRLERLKVDSGVIKNIYEAEGKALEMAMEDLFSPPFWHLAFERISQQDQRKGRPDFLLYTVDNEIIACEVTAKERNDHHIDKGKAEKILGSAAWRPPIARVVIGRPDFHELAIDNARNIVAEGMNYKLVPMYVLAEMYVRVHEGRLTSKDVESILRNEQGYLTFENLDKYSRAS